MRPSAVIAAPPPAAAAAFADRLPVARRYAELLGTAGIERGLLGPREAGRVWERHLLNSAALAPLIRPRARVVDLGSGAGLPGIPLAIARSDLDVVLLEPLARRAEFLGECVERLGLERVSVVRARAQEAALVADVVVVRAVAPLARLVVLAAPLLRGGGELLALKGRGAAAEVTAAADVVQHSGYAAAEVLELPAGEVTATVVRVRRRRGGGPTARRKARERGAR